ncbi:OmpA family protein [Stenotrophomonas sp. CPCC 101365]|uniref:OmpA family protein n=1 Tax=Stenotrophomonas mori TaxID=2871096 RepID=A0ABT0SHB2_9GAMM|nr:OmpA family protein [Stenotrophomonas mori]
MAALLLVACGAPPAPPEGGQAAAAPADPADAAAGGDPLADAGPQPPHRPVDAIDDRDGHPVALLPFDLERLPLSHAPLGALPFFGLPQGYVPLNPPQLRAWARFPFRLGEGVHWAEGPTWSARIATEGGKDFSALELQRNLESLVDAAGGRKVFEGPLHRDIYYGPQLEGEIGGGFIDAVNLDRDAPTAVYVVRQAQRTVWLQLAMDGNGAGLVVLEQQPFQASASWSAEFPHLSLPAGYRERNAPRQRDFDRFPFWTGERFEQVEGRTWAIDFDKGEREHSMHEVRRNLEAMMAAAGGHKVFEGRIPRDQAEALPQTLQAAYGDAAGYNWHDHDLLVYRAALPDGREVWVHARLQYLSAGWVVAERSGFVQTAALLPAADLKQALDSDGRVAIQVNFATDRAEILPASEPQLAQVLDLLQGDPALQLAVEGHTDGTGDAAHNRALSEARARAVVAALAGKGIDAGRLQAAGFGADRPVADNADEPGRARNRRVELVKR